ncbi:lycopene cyclase family protein, partial [Sphingomonas bacterium]|uniref:lycopene cyclase family protein n=1 Tax=Sphingomonas bacterium TaxID=1895847 RepID=UPI0015753760
MAATITCDVAIVGAGLAGGLLALALHRRHPGLDVRLIDGDDRVGGNHLWSFFASDVAAADQ